MDGGGQELHGLSQNPPVVGAPLLLENILHTFFHQHFFFFIFSITEGGAIEGKTGGG